MSSPLPHLGDPSTMRPSDHQTSPAYGDSQLGWDLADGRKLWLTWLPINQTHTHIVAWFEDQPDDPTVIANVVRANAGRVSQKEILDPLGLTR
jgi:hypothetical protein